MSQEDQDRLNDDQKKDDKEQAKTQTGLPTTQEELDALLNQRLDEKLAGIKGNLDKAYAARDEAAAEANRLREEKRQAEIAALEKEGKHAEALQLQLKEERAQNEALRQQNLALSRDNELNAVLATLPFRNKRAQDMAVQEIKPQLKADESGKWKHASGVSIADFVKTFADNEDNAFLFKQKQSSGGGSGAQKPGSSGEKEAKKLSSLSQAEVMKLAAEGKLKKR